MSEPSEKTHSLAATAALGPPLLPPGTRSVSQGLRVANSAEFSVDDPIANSSRLPLPSSTEPASCSRWVTVASNGGTKPSSIREEQVVTTPRVDMLSLSCIGMPVRGLASPAAIRSSARDACSRATSSVTVTKARTRSSTAAIRSRCASASSTDDTSRLSSSSRAS